MKLSEEEGAKEVKKSVKGKKAHEKGAVKDFERFALSGYKHTLFTNRLYRMLSGAFTFIAHYGRDGFYAARFGTWQARAETFEIMAQTVTWRAQTPLEKTIQKIVKDHELRDEALRERDAEVEERERAELARLKAKYEKA